MFRLTVVYPATEGGHFDFDYYVKSHIPMVAGFIGSSVDRTEAARGIAGAGTTPAPYAAVGHIYLRELGALQSAFERHGEQMGLDVPNYTNITPVVSIEEIVPA